MNRLVDSNLGNINGRSHARSPDEIKVIWSLFASSPLWRVAFVNFPHFLHDLKKEKRAGRLKIPPVLVEAEKKDDVYMWKSAEALERWSTQSLTATSSSLVLRRFTGAISSVLVFSGDDIV
jgi:hypothetical protein